jgi:hypothetical protein
MRRTIKAMSGKAIRTVKRSKVIRIWGSVKGCESMFWSVVKSSALSKIFLCGGLKGSITDPGD